MDTERGAIMDDEPKLFVFAPARGRCAMLIVPGFSVLLEACNAADSCADLLAKMARVDALLAGTVASPTGLDKLVECVAAERCGVRVTGVIADLPKQIIPGDEPCVMRERINEVVVAIGHPHGRTHFDRFVAKSTKTLVSKWGVGRLQMHVLAAPADDDRKRLWAAAQSGQAHVDKLLADNTAASAYHTAVLLVWQPAKKCERIVRVLYASGDRAACAKPATVIAALKALDADARRCLAAPVCTGEVLEKHAEAKEAAKTPVRSGVTPRPAAATAAARGASDKAKLEPKPPAPSATRARPAPMARTSPAVTKRSPPATGAAAAKPAAAPTRTTPGTARARPLASSTAAKAPAAKPAAAAPKATTTATAGRPSAKASPKTAAGGGRKATDDKPTARPHSAASKTPVIQTKAAKRPDKAEPAAGAKPRAPAASKVTPVAKESKVKERKSPPAEQHSPVEAPKMVMVEKVIKEEAIYESDEYLHSGVPVAAAAVEPHYGEEAAQRMIIDDMGLGALLPADEPAEHLMPIEEELTAADGRPEHAVNVNEAGEHDLLSPVPMDTDRGASSERVDDLLEEVIHGPMANGTEHVDEVEEKRESSSAEILASLVPQTQADSECVDVAPVVSPVTEERPTDQPQHETAADVPPDASAESQMIHTEASQCYGYLKAAAVSPPPCNIAGDEQPPVSPAVDDHAPVDKAELPQTPPAESPTVQIEQAEQPASDWHQAEPEQETESERPQPEFTHDDSTHHVQAADFECAALAAAAAIDEHVCAKAADALQSPMSPDSVDRALVVEEQQLHVQFGTESKLSPASQHDAPVISPAPREVPVSAVDEGHSAGFEDSAQRVQHADHVEHSAVRVTETALGDNPLAALLPHLAPQAPSGSPTNMSLDEIGPFAAGLINSIASAPIGSPPAAVASMAHDDSAAPAAGTPPMSHGPVDVEPLSAFSSFRTAPHALDNEANRSYASSAGVSSAAGSDRDAALLKSADINRNMGTAVSPVDESACSDDALANQLSASLCLGNTGSAQQHKSPADELDAMNVNVGSPQSPAANATAGAVSNGHGDDNAVDMARLQHEWGQPLGLPVATREPARKTATGSSKPTAAKGAEKSSPLYVDAFILPGDNASYGQAGIFDTVRAHNYILAVGAEGGARTDVLQAILEGKRRWTRPEMHAKIICSHDGPELEAFCVAMITQLQESCVEVCPPADSCTLQCVDAACPAQRVTFE